MTAPSQRRRKRAIKYPAWLPRLRVTQKLLDDIDVVVENTFDENGGRVSRSEIVRQVLEAWFHRRARVITHKLEVARELAALDEEQAAPEDAAWQMEYGW